MTVEIIHGDCRKVLPTAPDEAFDCIFADPPYGETSLAWDRWPEGWPSAARRVLKRTGSMWVFGSMRMFLERIGEFEGWKQAQDVIWEKHNGTGLLNDRFRRVHEIALQFYRNDVPWADIYKAPQFTSDATARTIRKKGVPRHFRKQESTTVYRSEDGGPRLMRSVIFARSDHGRAEHPTQKPTDIVEPLLRYACPPGGTVLDPFAGSGTTGVVAHRNGMNAVLIEADPDFAAIARTRLAKDGLFAAEVV